MKSFKVGIKKITDCSYDYIVTANSYDEAEAIVLRKLKESESNDDMMVEYEINYTTEINK
jgi:hypothetical protein